jgi:DNA-binding NarL/FixJ family response regulator
MIALVVYTSEPLNSIGLDLLFRSSADISLLSIVSDVPSLLHVSSGKPDVMLLSVDTNVDWGLITQLRRECPDAKIVLWLHDTTPEVAYQAVECGVRGILRKNLPPEMILKCVRKVFEGELWFEKALTQTFLSGRPIKVSRREGELIALVSQGLKNKEIASVMDITEGTVKVYLSRLFGKFGARDRFELALIGLRNSQTWIEPGLAAANAATFTLPSANETARSGRKKSPPQPPRVMFARAAQ